MKFENKGKWVNQINESIRKNRNNIVSESTQINEDKSFKDLNLDTSKGAIWVNSQGLTSLEGSPKKTDASFFCNNNKLTSLKGGPQEVFSFNCSNNQLTSLEGGPTKCEFSYDCSDNKLTSLKGAPERVGSSFNCNNNKLKNLIGAPNYVKAEFRCNNNGLTSLEGGPKYVGTFDCEKGNKITSLKGCPEVCFWDFNFNIDYLKSIDELDYLPRDVYEEFYLFSDKWTPELEQQVFDKLMSLKKAKKFKVGKNVHFNYKVIKLTNRK